MFKTTLITLALTAVTAAATPALAGEAGHAWQVGNDSYHLYVASQDLQTPTGRAAALARVEQAADRLCDGVGTRSEERACQAKIVQDVSGSLKPAIQQALVERTHGAAVELAANR